MWLYAFKSILKLRPTNNREESVPEKGNDKKLNRGFTEKAEADDERDGTDHEEQGEEQSRHRRKEQQQ